MAVYYAVWIVLAVLLGSETLAALAEHDLSALATPVGAGGYAALVVLSLANGVAEEVVMRAYLIPRFEQLFGGTAVALLLSTALFASYHAYQGPAGALSAATLGLVYGAVFLRFSPTLADRARPCPTGRFRTGDDALRRG